MRSRIPDPLLVLLAAVVVLGLPASGGPARAQAPDSTLKVPQNYDECDSLFDDLIAQWAETMVGGDYQKFLQQTNFDHIIPDLCKQANTSRFTTSPRDSSAPRARRRRSSNARCSKRSAIGTPLPTRPSTA